MHRSRGALPVLLSVPHSGRDYPPGLVAAAIGGKAALEGLADPLVDRLAWRALAAGIGAVIAQAPRAAVDCNRDPGEVDPAAVRGCGDRPVGHRARHGLGIVPARGARSARLWRQPIERDELDRRLAEAHEPFHAAIAAQLRRLADVHGAALLLDCHSMPSRPGQAELVIGDRHGRSAAPWLADEAARIGRSLGWTVALNHPYAGGHVAERHGRPREGLHALQIEIDRRRYLAADGASPGPGFDEAARLIEALAVELGEALAQRELLAAE